jgi:hypothetical protein
VRFIRDLGIGYRRLERELPIMDVFGFHPYPAKDRDPLHRGYRWPNAGVANLNRMKQAIWDAFNGTAQPTFAEPGLEQENPLTFKLDEVGWQVAIPRANRRAYFGRESVRPTNERTQAQIYRDLIKRISCDPSVHAMLFFGLVDEPNLDRWQAALVRADKTRRPAWGSVRLALLQGCRGKRVLWQHTERVVGAKVRRVGGRILISAEEDARVIVRGRSYALRAHRTLAVRAPVPAVVRFIAAMNAERETALAVG